jgi:hypothetical protein
MKKALIGLFILWGLSWLWYQGYREGWRQASEAAFAAVAALPAPPCTPAQSSLPLQPEAATGDSNP